MQRLLIVSPHFAPVNAPDLHRVRLALPWLRGHGWEPVVLAVHPDSVEGGVRDPLLEQTYPSDIRVVRVRGISPGLTRWARIGSLWLRCGRALRAAGDRLLSEEPFDLVFFSTTQFGAFTLGPRWKRKFGVPYVLDYQDPWINDHYARTGRTPPGGRLKFAFAQWRARRREPDVLRGAAGIVSVSDAYVRDLAARHPGFDAARARVIPFGASEDDIVLARARPPARPLVPFGDGCIHQVYTGRGGGDMAPALTLLFRAFRRFLDARPEEAARLRFHFIGTSYAPPPLGRETVMPVARAEGVAAYVHEHCARVPYFESLHYLARADAILAPGSDDPAYSASKIFPCLLARRPLLALFHRDSPVHAFLRAIRCDAGHAFDTHENMDGAASRLADAWFVRGGMLRVPCFDADAFRPFTARGMTQALAACFAAACGGSRPA